jgi:hypothetical protein
MRMSGMPSSNTPASMWTQYDTYMDVSRLGTIHIVSSTFGGLTKELMTVVSPSMFTSLSQQSELFDELLDLWQLVPPV